MRKCPDCGIKVKINDEQYHHITYHCGRECKCEYGRRLNETLEKKEKYFCERYQALDIIFTEGTYRIVDDIGYLGFGLDVERMTTQQWSLLQLYFRVNNIKIENRHTIFYLSGPIIDVKVK